jgi:hypothetical protein
MPLHKLVEKNLKISPIDRYQCTNMSELLSFARNRKYFKKNPFRNRTKLTKTDDLCDEINNDTIRKNRLYSYVRDLYLCRSVATL